MILSLLTPLLLQQAVPADAQPATTSAASMGTVLYALDRAAWVATDAMLKAIPRDRLPAGGGWVVERGADRTLIVTFYAGSGTAARVVFVADVRDGRVADSRIPAADTMLTDAQQRLARAREAAVADAAKRGLTPCAKAAFNPVVVPVDGATIPVYLLTPQVETGRYPAGGHYRYAIDGQGKAVAVRPFTRSCLTLGAPAAARGQAPAGLFVSHLLDPTPTEIHVFTSLSARLPVFVGTGARVWRVDGRTITLSDMKPPPAPQ